MTIAIISSKGFWQNGWLPNLETLKYFEKTLEESSIPVQSFEVENVRELERLLSKLDPETLLLPNAYHVNSISGNSELKWMGDIIEQFNFKSIGSSAAALKNVLQKHVCQKILKEHGIPVPAFAFIHPKDLGNEKRLLEEADFTYPVIVKLTGESCGVGISNESVAYDEIGAINKARLLIEKYAQGVIVESFLPGDDITAARFVIDGNPLHLATHYFIEDNMVLGYNERKIPWGKGKRMVPVNEPAILEQLDGILPKVWKIMGIKDVMRLDGKLDSNGQFRVFDVNGFPGLVPNLNTFPVQCNTCFPDYSNQEVYRAMVNTIVLSAARRHNMATSSALEQYNLLSMNQSLVDKPEFISMN